MKTAPSLIMLACLLAWLPARAASNVARDGSLGTGPTSALLPAGSVTSNGITYGRIAIPESYGTRAGTNVFHSFSTFDIGAGEAAVFGLSAAASNIISRVTGGQVSSIAGLLTVDAGATGSRPNVFLINPAGVTFSAGAALDVPAAFHVTTANVITFADGRFDADPTQASTLSSAAPAAFGFLGATRATVALTPGVSVQGATGGSISVAAGDISIDGAALGTTNGNLRLAAAGSGPSTIAVAGALPSGLQGQLYIGPNASAGSATFDQQAAGDVSVGAGDILIDGQNAFSGIFSYSYPGSSGNAGAVSVKAVNNMFIIGGGSVFTQSDGDGHAGSLTLGASDLAIRAGGYVHSTSSGAGNAGAIRLDGTNITVGGGTGISSLYSWLSAGGSGQAGPVEVYASGALAVVTGGQINSYTFGTGPGAALDLRANSIVIDGLGGSAIVGAGANGPGTPGAIGMTATGNLSIFDGGFVSSSNRGVGAAGAMTVSAAAIDINGFGGSAGMQSLGVDGAAANLAISTPGALSLTGGGYISSVTLGAGQGGQVAINAGNVSIDGLFSSIGSESGLGSSGNSGTVSVLASGTLTVANEGLITSTTNGDGDSGGIVLRAGDILVDGLGNNAAVSSSALSASSGNAGSIDMAALRSVTLRDGGYISSSSAGPGNAGAITIRGASMLIDDRPGALFQTGVFSDTYFGSAGNSGLIDMAFTGGFSMLGSVSVASRLGGDGNSGGIGISAATIALQGTGGNSALISADASAGSTGNGGAVSLRSSGQLSMRGDAFIVSGTSGSGDAGTINISAGNMEMGGPGGLAGIFSNTFAGSSGAGGNVSLVSAGLISMHDGAAIRADTYGSGDAGSVNVRAGALTIQAQGSATGISTSARTGSSGAAGDITLTTTGRLALINEATIESHTSGPGDAGAILVDAGSMLIEGSNTGFLTGLSSAARLGSSGNAGSISVLARGELAMTNDGEISSSTEGSGAAGSINVDAGTLRLDNSHILASAFDTSAGQVGNVTVRARDAISLANDAFLAIENYAVAADPSVLVPGQLQVRAPFITLENSSRISTSSLGNVNPGAIAILAGERLTLRDSVIATVATDGDGGAISIDGGRLLSMRDSVINTSVLGASGNGGDIAIHADVLLMQTAAIKANTAAQASSGGDVLIDVDALITSGNSLLLGGSTVFVLEPGIFGFNVIQAAAPTGVSGNVVLNSPVLDVAGALSALAAHRIDSGGLGRSPCQAGGTSVLAMTGRGGLAPSARGWIAPAPTASALPGPRQTALVQFGCRKG